MTSRTEKVMSEVVERVKAHADKLRLKKQKLQTQAM